MYKSTVMFVPRDIFIMYSYKAVILSVFLGGKRRLRMSCDSSVGIATRYRLDGPGSIPGNARYLSSRQRPSTQQVPTAPSPRVKRQGREADHSPPHSAEVTNCGAIPPLPHMSSWHSA
jgi:hypothetical protein